jgi:hypothetical protein
MLRAASRIATWKTVTVFAAALLSFASGPVTAAPSHDKDAPAASDRDRYVELYKRRERAERLNAMWKVEAELAAKRTAYAVLDLSDRKLYFKVRGKTFKAISFTGLEAVRGSRPVAPEELAWRAFTLELKEGKGVETETIQRKSLSAEEARQAGRTEGDADEEPIGAEQGAVESGAVTSGSGSASGTGAAPAEPQKMQGVAGGAIPPDPPPIYHMGFDGGLSIWVIADSAPSPQASRYAGVLDLATRIGRMFSGGSEESNEVRMTVHLPLNLGQQIFRQLLPGQRLLVTL